MNNPDTKAVLEVLRKAAFSGKEANVDIEGYSELTVGRSSDETVSVVGNTFNLKTEQKSGPAMGKAKAAATWLANKVGKKGFKKVTRTHTSIQISVKDQLNMLGVYLHSMQDSYGHHGGQIGHGRLDIKDPKTGKILKASWASTHADVPYVRPKIALAAAKNTHTKIRAFLDEEQNKKYGMPKARLDWAATQALATAFIEARNVKDKQKAYQGAVTALLAADPTLKKGKLKEYSKFMPEIEVVVQAIHDEQTKDKIKIKVGPAEVTIGNTPTPAIPDLDVKAELAP